MDKSTYRFFTNLIDELDLAEPHCIDAIEPLTGGVASDIVRVAVGDRQFCLKCALEKLKVAQDWHAPQHRNKAEYAWLQVAASINPDGAVKLLGQSRNAPCFAMEYLAGDDIFLWKTALLAGRVQLDEARSVGRAMGRIHAASTAPDFDQTAFHNQDDFYQLRLDPYLNATASRHPDVADRLERLVNGLYSSAAVLVHGDISPKNILFRAGQPVFLDAECATMGDPCFDVAFCLNHLILKAIHVPTARTTLLEAVIALWDDYAGTVVWEDAQQLEVRVCDLLPGLMLARIDGKSPVEYLSEPDRALTRRLALDCLRMEPSSLQDLTTTIAHYLDTSDP